MIGTPTRGTAAIDLRHVISANVVYLLPFHGNRWKDGWQLTGIQAWHTGVPFSLTEGDQADLQNNFGSARPSYVGGCNVYANQSVTNWFNNACFVASPYGTVGNLGRNNIIGPGYVDTDFGLMKNTRINETVQRAVPRGAVQYLQPPELCYAEWRASLALAWLPRRIQPRTRSPRSSATRAKLSSA